MAGNIDVSLTWTSAAGDFAADHWEVYRNLDSAGYALLDTVTQAALTDRIAIGSSATYKVLAYDIHNNVSPYSNVYTKTLTLSLPQAPTLTSSLNAATVTLDWTASVAGTYSIKDYLVKRSLNSGPVTTRATVSAASARTYSETLLPSDSATYYLVARDFYDNVAPNSNQETETLAALTAPVLSSSLATTTVSLSWTASTGPAPISGYQVYRDLNSAGYLILDTVVGLSLDDVLSVGDTATYKVRSFDTGFNVSAYSNQETETVPANQIQLPLTYDELDKTASVTMTRAGNKSISRDGFVANGHSSKLTTTTLPAWLTSATAELGVQLDVAVCGPNSDGNATTEETLFSIGSNAATMAPKVALIRKGGTGPNQEILLAIQTAGGRQDTLLLREEFQYRGHIHEASNAGQAARMQGLQYYSANDTMLYSVHFNDTLSRIYEVSKLTWTVLRQFDIPSPYVHIAGIAKDHNGAFWVSSFIGSGGSASNNKILKLDIEASLNSGSAVITSTVSLDTASFGLVAGSVGLSGMNFCTIGGVNYVLFGMFANTGVNWTYVMLHSKLTDGASLVIADRVKRYQNDIGQQGIAVKGNYLYESYSGITLGGVIRQVDLATFIASGSDGANITAMTRLIFPAPARLCEDLTFDDVGLLWCGTEGLSSVGDFTRWQAAFRIQIDNQVALSGIGNVDFRTYMRNTYTLNYDGAGTWTVFINGLAWDTLSFTPNTVPAAIAIGAPVQAASATDSGYSHGFVSSVRIQDLVIAQGEIASIAAGGDESSALTAVAVPLANTDAESGTGSWTAEIGGLGTRSLNPIPYDPASTAYFTGGANLETLVRQRFSNATLGISNSDMDTKDPWVVLGWGQASFDASTDPMQCGARFLTSGAATLATSEAEGSVIVPSLTWKRRVFSAGIAPDTTRNIDVLMHFNRTAGMNNDGYTEDIRAFVYVP